MVTYEVEYGYMLPEWSTIAIELDETLPRDEREAIALAEIKGYNPDISDIEILNMKAID